MPSKKNSSLIPGITYKVFSEVLANQAQKENEILLKASKENKSDLYDCLLFFMGIAYNLDKFKKEIVITEKFLFNHQHLLSDFELGIYYHAKGFLYLKKGPNHYHIVFEALNKSVDYLNSVNTKPAKYYMARVCDTYAQALQTIGFYKDALLLFQDSLKIKKKFKDEQSVALTHGNLGRLNFGIGNFKLAIKHLELDLKILEKAAGEEGLKSKMMNQIAVGLIEQNDYPGAKKYIDRSLGLAIKAGITTAFFAQYTLAYFYLQTHEVIKAKEIISKLKQLLKRETDTNNKKILLSRIHYLSGLMALFNGKPVEATQYFIKTEEVYINDYTNSITEKAHFYYYQSQALDKSGYYNESSLKLRKAILLLDQTENVALRRMYENTLKERHKDGWLLHAAGRFIGQEQIEMVLSETGKDGFRGKSMDLAIMFSDIRDFTKLSEGMDANSLIELLNRYLGNMSKYIHLQGGVIDKYIGDAIMALFFPKSATQLSMVENACIAALMMKAELKRFNRQLPSRDNKIQAGIGINFGNCVSGMIGTAQKRSLSVIGDTVNIASRIEGLTKVMGTAIIISESVYSKLSKKHNFVIRPLGKYRLMGKSAATALYELMGVADNSSEVNTQKEEILEMENALLKFSAKKFKEAHGTFSNLCNRTATQGRSKGYQFMADYTKDLIGNDLPKNWDGCFEITNK